MNYEWDDNKLAINLDKHRLHFSIAEQFDWETAMIEADTRKNYSEDRYCAFGLIGTRLYCLVYTLRNDVKRIISLRKANSREVKRYVAEN
ncbi:MAG: BrnT family toxin [Methylomicrobium sp.]|nr:BrnT family toxin [Methylomicrobium sp.]